MSAAGRRDSAGRWQAVTDNPETTSPEHVWQGDDDGHNCRACPHDGIWRCDRPAHLVTDNEAAV